MVDNQVTCSFCKTVSNYHSQPYLKDGVWKRAGICPECYGKYDHLVSFCHQCEGYYSFIKVWGPNIPAATVLPCKKHSVKSDYPTIKCAVCTELVSHGYGVSTNARGQSFCGSHSMSLVPCGAAYCQTAIHKNQSGVVQSAQGTKIYCEDCAVARQTPAQAPPDYHPLTWDYRPGCLCAVCVYLAGRSDKWPKAGMQVVDGTCGSCSSPLSIETAHWCDFDQFYRCHICTIAEFKTCGKCKKLKLESEFHGSTPALTSLRCNACMLVLKYWFCDVQCKRWFKKDCSCGGVHSYNYSAEPVFQWATDQRQVTIETVPFLGVEIEVEAQLLSATRVSGAKLVKELAGDYSYLVHDGTLLGSKSDGTGGDRSFEIVTHPFTFEWFEEKWDEIEHLLTTLSSKGYRSWQGGRCGIHIHVSRAPMSDGHQMKYINFIYGSSNLSMCVGQRRYRDKNLRKFSPFDGEDRSQFIKKVRSFTNPRVQGHYAALNANKPATLEARWFRGTLNPTGFRKNVEFIHSVWYFTKSFGFSSANEMNYITWLRDEVRQTGRYRILLDFIEREYVTRR